MLYIDNIALKAIIDNTVLLLKEYEEVIINLFNELKDCNVNWQDSQSIQFDGLIYREKNETYMFFHLLEDYLDIYNYIYEKYKKIGNQIDCNFGFKESLSAELDECNNEFNNILDKLNNLDLGYDYFLNDNILGKKSEIVTLKNRLLMIKENIKNIYIFFETNEKNIKFKINALNIINIDDFVLNYNQKTFAMSGGLINEELLVNNIKKIDFYLNEEKDVLDRIYANFLKCSDKYRSENSRLFSDNLQLLKNSIEKIHKKRKESTN